MVIGSHNSWSFLKPVKWWKRPFAFMARCQRVDIRKQYELGTRCFDLRLRLNNDGVAYIAHGLVEYNYTLSQLLRDLTWLDNKGDCYVRVMHEVRSKRQYTDASIGYFRGFCEDLEENYKKIKFWGGRNFYNWGEDYVFSQKEPTSLELHASVSRPRLIDDWWPWLYAYMHNDLIKMIVVDKDILLMDFVDMP